MKLGFGNVGNHRIAHPLVVSSVQLAHGVHYSVHLRAKDSGVRVGLLGVRVGFSVPFFERGNAGFERGYELLGGGIHD
jgi:hypothetical protein